MSSGTVRLLDICVGDKSESNQENTISSKEISHLDENSCSADANSSFQSMPANDQFTACQITLETSKPVFPKFDYSRPFDSLCQKNSNDPASNFIFKTRSFQRRSPWECSRSPGMLLDGTEPAAIGPLIPRSRSLLETSRVYTQSSLAVLSSTGTTIPVQLSGCRKSQEAPGLRYRSSRETQREGCGLFQGATQKSAQTISDVTGGADTDGPINLSRSMSFQEATEMSTQMSCMRMNSIETAAPEWLYGSVMSSEDTGIQMDQSFRSSCDDTDVPINLSRSRSFQEATEMSTQLSSMRMNSIKTAAPERLYGGVMSSGDTGRQMDQPSRSSYESSLGSACPLDLRITHLETAVSEMMHGSRSFQEASGLRVNSLEASDSKLNENKGPKEIPPESLQPACVAMKNTENSIHEGLTSNGSSQLTPGGTTTIMSSGVRIDERPTRFPEALSEDSLEMFLDRGYILEDFSEGQPISKTVVNTVDERMVLEDLDFGDETVSMPSEADTHEEMPNHGPTNVVVSRNQGANHHTIEVTSIPYSCPNSFQELSFIQSQSIAGNLEDYFKLNELSSELQKTLSFENELSSLSKYPDRNSLCLDEFYSLEPYVHGLFNSSLTRNSSETTKSSNEVISDLNRGTILHPGSTNTTKIRASSMTSTPFASRPNNENTAISCNVSPISSMATLQQTPICQTTFSFSASGRDILVSDCQSKELSSGDLAGRRPIESGSALSNSSNTGTDTAWTLRPSNLENMENLSGTFTQMYQLSGSHQNLPKNPENTLPSASADIQKGDDCLLLEVGTGDALVSPDQSIPISPLRPLLFPVEVNLEDQQRALSFEEMRQKIKENSLLLLEVSLEGQRKQLSQSFTARGKNKVPFLDKTTCSQDILDIGMNEIADSRNESPSFRDSSAVDSGIETSYDIGNSSHPSGSSSNNSQISDNTTSKMTTSQDAVQSQSSGSPDSDSVSSYSGQKKKVVASPASLDQGSNIANNLPGVVQPELPSEEVATPTEVQASEALVNNTMYSLVQDGNTQESEKVMRVEVTEDLIVKYVSHSRSRIGCISEEEEQRLIEFIRVERPTFRQWQVATGLLEFRNVRDSLPSKVLEEYKRNIDSCMRTLSRAIVMINTYVKYMKVLKSSQESNIQMLGSLMVRQRQVEDRLSRIFQRLQNVVLFVYRNPSRSD